MAVRPVKASGIAGVTPAQREGIMLFGPEVGGPGSAEETCRNEQGIVQGGRSDLERRLFISYS